jgi:hypothetical protein
MLRVTTLKIRKLSCTRPKIPSALRPVAHGPEVPVHQPTEILEDASTNSSDSVEMMRNFSVIHKVKVCSCSLRLN